MSGTNVSPSAQKDSSAPSVPDIHPRSTRGTQPSAVTPVYFWNLEDEHSTGHEIPTYSQNMPSVRVNDAIGAETVVNSTDGRTQVDFKEYEEANGKFRAIVKLFLLYEGQIEQGVDEDDATWAIATGWLIAKDVVVTAGHCAYDWDHGLGRLKKVKAYIGYTGQHSIGKPEVEFQPGKVVVTTPEWIDIDGGDEQKDIAFIKLRTPFNAVDRCYGWKETPISQHSADIGVVGYPGDIVDDRGERGATMYQMFKHTNYNLQTSYRNMLQYGIDTNGGNSGSPVFSDRVSPHTVIGVHVLGGQMFNSASVFAGVYGNKFAALFHVANQHDNPTHPDPDKRAWLCQITAPTGESLDNDHVQNELIKTINIAGSVSQDIPDTVLDSGTLICFGKSAGPQISILASAALGTAGKILIDSPTESMAASMANTRSYDGILSRAILAEAALQCFLEQTSTKRAEFFQELGPVVASIKPFILKIAPKILNGILEPSMRLLLSNLKREDALDKGDKREARSAAAEKDTGFGGKLSEQESAFIEGLMSKVDTKEVESFYSTLTTIGDLIGSAFKKAGPALLDVAKIGLPLFLGTESGGFPSNDPLTPLVHRAILAEACLQAYITRHKHDPQKERLFSTLVDKLKTLGPKLMKAAPLMAKCVGPLVVDLLRERKEDPGK